MDGLVAFGAVCAVGSVSVFLRAGQLARELADAKAVQHLSIGEIRELCAARQQPVFAIVEGEAHAATVPVVVKGLVECLIWVEDIVRHVSRYHGSSEGWRQHKELVVSTSRSRPFLLRHGNDTLLVSDQGWPHKPVTDTLHTTFTPAQPRSLMHRLMEYLTGESELGKSVVEQALLPGTPLTAVGTVQVDRTGGFHMPAPQRVQKQSKHSVLESMASHVWYARLGWRVLAGAALVSLVYWAVRRSGLSWRDVGRALRSRATRARQSLNAEIAQRNDALARNLQRRRGEESPRRPGEEARAVDEGACCVVCLDSPRETVLLPCGHLVMCQECVDAMTRTAGWRGVQCPLCREHVSNAVRVYSP